MILLPGQRSCVIHGLIFEIASCPRCPASVSFGPMRPDERPWVASTWLRAYEHAEVMGGAAIPRPAYWRKFGELVNALMDADYVLVARDPNDATQALGWLCRQRLASTCHFLYVKWMFRDRKGMGAPLNLAARLLDESGLDVSQGLRCTFTTTAWLKYAANRGIQFEHDRQLVSVTRAAIRRSSAKEKVA